MTDRHRVWSPTYRRIVEIRMRLRQLAWNYRERQWREAEGDAFVDVAMARVIGGDTCQCPKPGARRFNYSGPRREWWWHA